RNMSVETKENDPETARKRIVKYELPRVWIQYDLIAVVPALVDAKAAVMALRTIPYQRAWAEALQKIQLKREVAGTSRIEGADFTDRELEEALKESAEDLMTRSQRQAHAAMLTYRWISNLPDDFPITADLIRNIHRLLIEGADD